MTIVSLYYNVPETLPFQKPHEQKRNGDGSGDFLGGRKVCHIQAIYDEGVPCPVVDGSLPSPHGAFLCLCGEKSTADLQGSI